MRPAPSTPVSSVLTPGSMSITLPGRTCAAGTRRPTSTVNDTNHRWAMRETVADKIRAVPASRRTARPLKGTVRGGWRPGAVGMLADVITRDEIRTTYDIIRPYVRRTPVIRLSLNDLDPAVTLKLEQLQCAGSFKARGAFTNLLLRDVPPAGVVAASGGNHGVAVAYAAHRLGVPARIFVPTVSAAAKVERIRQLGAELVVTGERYADALAAAQDWERSSGAMSVHAFDQRETLLGQGTLALELAGQAPDLDAGDLDTVLVPVGGGGLIGGIAAWFGGEVRVIGIEPEGAPTLTRARAEGRPADAPAEGVAADALAPRRVGELVFPITQAYVEDVVLVDDTSILAAQRALWQAARIAAEPAASVGIAALLTGGYKPAPGEHVAVVISGANMSPAQLETRGDQGAQDDRSG